MRCKLQSFLEFRFPKDESIKQFNMFSFTIKSNKLVCFCVFLQINFFCTNKERAKNVSNERVCLEHFYKVKVL